MFAPSVGIVLGRKRICLGVCAQRTTRLTRASAGAASDSRRARQYTASDSPAQSSCKLLRAAPVRHQTSQRERCCLCLPSAGIAEPIATLSISSFISALTSRRASARSMSAGTVGAAADASRVGSYSLCDCCVPRAGCTGSLAAITSAVSGVGQTWTAGGTTGAVVLSAMRAAVASSASGIGTPSLPASCIANVLKACTPAAICSYTAAPASAPPPGWTVLLVAHAYISAQLPGCPALLGGGIVADKHVATDALAAGECAVTLQVSADGG